MFGYSSKRPGVIITHVINFTEKELADMSEHSHCFDSRPEYNWASFVHLHENEYNDFMDCFDVMLVDTKSELQFVKKLTD